MSAQLDTEPRPADPAQRGRHPARRDARPWNEIEAELACGLRNHWYAVAPSDEVPADRPAGVQRMGEFVN